MARGEIDPVSLSVKTMVVIAVAALLLVIARPNIVGLGERSNATQTQAFDSIQGLITTQCSNIQGASCQSSCPNNKVKSRGTCSAQGEVCCATGGSS